MKAKSNGFTEGAARAITQGCVYALESQKTMIQLYARAASSVDPLRFLVGSLTSASAAGLVFGAYFNIYHSIGAQNPLAGPVAATCVSVIKQPLSNTIRLMQAGVAPNVFQASRKIVSAQGVGGLYKGYGVSLAEDMIEWDMRMRLYDELKGMLPIVGWLPAECVGAVIGAMSGMMAAWVTTPFDTVRANMAMLATRRPTARQDTLRVIGAMWKKGGLPMMYRGARLRAMSSGVKFAMFYAIVEAAKRAEGERERR